MPDRAKSSHPDTAKVQRSVSIVGTGSYTPSRVLSNAELEKIVETSNDWILTRTGISERRIAGDSEYTSAMAANAARAAMENAKVRPEEIDLIIVATVSPDMMFPATACFVQTAIGATNAACFDLSAACSGFLYGVEVAHRFITSHAFNTALVIGADKLSALVDWTDRNTCVLFGDGAGAAILQHRADSRGIVSCQLGADGSFDEILSMPGGGIRCPITPENVHLRLNTIKMSGREVYKQAVTAMVGAAHKALEKAGLTADDITCFIPHQANMRIIESVAHKLHVSLDRFFVNLDRYGNTSAAAVAIALDEANRTGRIKRGDYALLVVFGGGLTWASTVVQW